MALLLKQNPVGLDIIVNRVQNKLFPLIADWAVDIDIYPRCYISKTKEGTKDIYYYAGADENPTVLYAETNKFFFTSDYELEQSGNDYYKTKLDLYVILNVQEIKDIEHRADEECVVDILNALSSCVGIKVKKVFKGIERVFNAFEYSIEGDLQPYFVAKFELDVLEFDINNNCIN